MTKPQFIQIAAMPGCIGGHDCGIFALDEEGTVWHYEGRWVAFSDERAPKSEDEPSPFQKELDKFTHRG